MSTEDTNGAIKPLGMLTDAMKHLSIVAAGLSAILLSFLEHMMGWQKWIGRGVIAPLFASICVSLVVIWLAVGHASKGHSDVTMTIRRTAGGAAILFAFGILMLIPVAFDVSPAADPSAKIEFLKQISDKDKKQEAVKNWKTMFPEDDWIKPFESVQ